jgi:hypothetical protein
MLLQSEGVRQNAKRLLVQGFDSGKLREILGERACLTESQDAKQEASSLGTVFDDIMWRGEEGLEENQIEEEYKEAANKDEKAANKDEKAVIRSIAPPGGPPQPVMRSIAPPGGPPKPVLRSVAPPGGPPCIGPEEAAAKTLAPTGRGQFNSTLTPSKDVKQKLKDLLEQGFDSGKLQEILDKQISPAATQSQDARAEKSLDQSVEKADVAKTLANAPPTEEAAAIAA